MNLQKFFGEFKNHIEDGEINEIKNLSKTLNDQLGRDAIWLPIMTDEEGNNLLHLAISTGSIDTVRTLVEETKNLLHWSSICPYMENKQGLKPVDSIPLQAEERFKSVIKRNFSPIESSIRFEQFSIIEQCQRYLISQTIKNPEEYKLEDVVNIINDIHGGMCLGLSGLWAQSILSGQPEIYFNMIEKIMNCHDFSKNMEPALQQHFEYTIQLVRSFLLIGKDLDEAREKKYRFNPVLDQSKDMPYQKQEDVVAIWGQQKYLQNEYYLSYYPGPDHFGDFFINFVNPQNDGKLIMIDGLTHSTACYFKENKFYFFDSNKEIKTSDNGISYTAIVDVNLDPDYNLSLGKIVQDALYPKGVEPSWDDITFRVVDKLGSNVGLYPSKQELENRKSSLEIPYSATRNL
ncbi:hypothetical protein LDG_5572 [Legionella drancourtii LLAP12]|uniref:Ankyrin repeat-containing protein n=2 Tax=Legionella drancourtii TaxID=168933 RepID=G9EK49_9GAMM|nr:hypothetical protein LDG_5572 [Legionella drancourtii LLAP12]